MKMKMKKRKKEEESEEKGDDIFNQGKRQTDENREEELEEWRRYEAAFSIHKVSGRSFCVAVTFRSFKVDRMFENESDDFD